MKTPDLKFRSAWSFPCLVALSMAAFAAEVAAGDRRFYRITAAPGTLIESLTLNGSLSWTNPAAEGTYLIETGTDLNTWQPWARGFVTGTSSSLKVSDPATPPGMSYIPGGYFTMGDNVAVTFGNIVHKVIVSPFYISSRETTVGQAREVFQWGLDHGKLQTGTEPPNYTTLTNTEGDPKFLTIVNSGKSILRLTGTTLSLAPPLPAQPPAIAWSAVHPITAITWYGAVVYCNFRSEMEGKEPCYNLNDWTCDFQKSGYRLPTESEWEKAARGGMEGLRFPWGDTITHSEANYNSTTANSYDISPTRSTHPVYAANRPIYTAPTGSFAPNGYGLYDVCGNVYEWCWDTAGSYNGQTRTDPKGPDVPAASGNPMFKGGSFLTAAERVLLASRYVGYPRDFTHEDIGFRVALNAAP
jgi:formylglycine-generating enzyme required for sulfatase activity